MPYNFLVSFLFIAGLIAILQMGKALFMCNLPEHPPWCLILTFPDVHNSQTEGGIAVIGQIRAVDERGVGLRGHC